MTETSQVETPIDRFIAYLHQRRDERGTMADLRHGFSDGTAYRAWPHVAPWCDLTDDRQRAIILTVAAGFATLGASEANAGNFGQTLRRIAIGDGGSDKGLVSFEGRFRRLLTCNTPQELCPLLSGLLRAAARRGIGVDFARLYRDLRYWNADTHAKVQWAAAFWGTESATASDTDGADVELDVDTDSGEDSES